MREINSNTVLKNGKTFKDILKNRAVPAFSKSHPLPKSSFEEIFGDLSDCAFSGTLDMTGLNLKTLEGFPVEFEDISQIYLSYDLFKDFHTLEGNVRKNISHGIKHFCLVVDFSLEEDIDPMEETDMIAGVIMTIVNNFNIKFENITFLDSDYCIERIDQKKFLRQEEIYKKVNFDQDKFKRVLALI